MRDLIPESDVMAYERNLIARSQFRRDKINYLYNKLQNNENEDGDDDEEEGWDSLTYDYGDVSYVLGPAAASYATSYDPSSYNSNDCMSNNAADGLGYRNTRMNYSRRDDYNSYNNDYGGGDSMMGDGTSNQGAFQQQQQQGNMNGGVNAMDTMNMNDDWNGNNNGGNDNYYEDPNNNFGGGAAAADSSGAVIDVPLNNNMGAPMPDQSNNMGMLDQSEMQFLVRTYYVE